MQTIWSRAFQIKSTCRCPSCYPNQFAISKRPSTAAARRSFRYGDIATFFYSSVLATAAVADAQRKDTKRKNLDKAIAEAVEALKAVELEQLARLQNLHKAQHELQVIEIRRKGRVEALRKTIGDTSLAKQKAFIHRTPERFDTKTLASRSALEVAEETLSSANWNAKTTNVKVETDLKRGHGHGVTSSNSKGEDITELVPAEVSAELKDEPEAAGLFGPQRVRDSDAGGIDGKAQNMSERSAYDLSSLVQCASQWLSYDESSMDLTRGQESTKVWLSTYRIPALSHHKILIINTSIAKLIYRLLLMSLDSDDNKEVVLYVGNSPWVLRSQHRPELRMRIVDMDDRLAKLKSEPMIDAMAPLPFPNYSNHVDYPPDTDLLHKILQNTLAKKTSIDDLLSNICYDLLISEASPSIHTYNMLIIRFCYLQHYQVAAAIIDSLFECRLRPNEITTAAILRFYSNTGDFVAFKSYVSMMNAERNRGLMTAPITTEITPKNKNHFIMLREGEVSYKRRGIPLSSRIKSLRRDLRYIEKAPRNQDTYAALIHGWLSFSDIRCALREYVTMIRTGWKADQTILIDLLSYCTLKSHWDWGLAIWSEIVETFDRPDSTAYYWMLLLCTRFQETKVSDTVLYHGIERQILPADMCQKEFVAPMETVERDFRLLGMLREHIPIPGLAPLQQRSRYGAKQPTGNISLILSASLEDADIEQLARARMFIENLNTLSTGCFKRLEINSTPPVIVPYEHTDRNSSPKLSLSSAGKLLSQAVISFRRLAVGNDVFLAQESHRPLDNSPNHGTSQASKMVAPRIRSRRWLRRKALRVARFVAEKEAKPETQRKASSAAPAVNNIEDHVENENAIADHLGGNSQLLPLIASTALSRVLEQLQEYLSNTQQPHASVPANLPQTSASGLHEQNGVVSGRSVHSETDVSSTMLSAAIQELSEKVATNLTGKRHSQSEIGLTTPFTSTQVQTGRIAITLTKSKKPNLAKPLTESPVAVRKLFQEVKSPVTVRRLFQEVTPVAARRPFQVV